MQAGSERRSRLREALLDLCFEQGIRSTTLDQLLDRADVGAAAFAGEFAGLEDCFCQIYAEERDRMLAEIARATAAGAWRDRLRAAAYALLRSLNRDRRVAHLVMSEVRCAGERAQILMEEGIEATFELLDQGRGELEDPATISQSTAESIGGGIFGQIYVAVERDFPLREEVVPQMLYAAVLPYLGPVAAAEELRIPPPPTPSGHDSQ